MGGATTNRDGGRDAQPDTRDARVLRDGRDVSPPPVEVGIEAPMLDVSLDTPEPDVAIDSEPVEIDGSSIDTEGVDGGID
jgi:hypothetical protein